MSSMTKTQIVRKAVNMLMDDTLLEIYAFDDNNQLNTLVVLIDDNIRDSVVASWQAVENAEYYFPDGEAIFNNFLWLVDLADVNCDIEVG